MHYPVQFYVPVNNKPAKIYRDRFAVGSASVEITARQREQLLRMAARNSIGEAAELWGTLISKQLLVGCNSQGELLFRKARQLDPVEA